MVRGKKGGLGLEAFYSRCDQQKQTEAKAKNSFLCENRQERGKSAWKQALSLNATCAGKPVRCDLPVQ